MDWARKLVAVTTQQAKENKYLIATLPNDLSEEKNFTNGEAQQQNVLPVLCHIKQQLLCVLSHSNSLFAKTRGIRDDPIQS